MLWLLVKRLSNSVLLTFGKISGSGVITTTMTQAYTSYYSIGMCDMRSDSKTTVAVFNRHIIYNCKYLSSFQSRAFWVTKGNSGEDPFTSWYITLGY